MLVPSRKLMPSVMSRCWTRSSRRSQTPCFAQRMKSCAASHHGPNSAGMLRHFAPFWCRQKIAKIVGPVEKFFCARFVKELGSVKLVSDQLLVEIQPFRSPIRNHKLDHTACSHSSHTGREKFATGPSGSGEGGGDVGELYILRGLDKGEKVKRLKYLILLKVA